MKKTFIYSLILLLGFAVFSCKKEDKKTSSGGGGGPVNSNPTNSSGYYGEIIISQTEILNFNSTPVNMIIAVFYNSPLTNTQLRTINVGTLTVNGVRLKVDNSNPPNPAYLDTTMGLISGPPFVFNASGNSSQSAFTLSYNQQYPTLVDTGSVPSVITRSLGLSLTFTNVAATNTLTFIIEDQSGKSLQKTTAVTNNIAHINFTPSELSVLSAAVYGGINFGLQKRQTLTANSKNYSLTLEKRLFKFPVQIN